MKNALTGLLTLLLLLFTAVASIAIVAFALAVVALFSPLLILGGALSIAGNLSKIIRLDFL
ncbi:hypothetical protein [Legionella resiliens]|uniref:Transmembrane protein n=1 Tax=Legionella resiliens TaxID=2905958 RepID=A0ABS8X0Q5_9GAMM|nr:MULTISPECIES: hypothetical protein [unclassified Legionella]MCE0722187.1 hypothetical protein [Legionella sp. 9fVS26]MCE3531341.1 hypothetical protein [Legionella sp. 8cVS16]